MKIPASILVLFFSYNLALACSCQRLTDEQKDRIIQDLPIVFQGRVIAINSSRFSEASDLEVKFQVLRSWKGVEKDEIIIKTPSHAASCGFSFAEDSTYIVYAQENPPSTITCTMMAVDENRVKKFLGEGKTFEDLSSQKEGFFGWLWRKVVSFFS